MEAEILHLIIEAAKSGKLPLPAPFTGTTFNKVILVGHSVGSLVSNELNWRYPYDVDATILTGYAQFYALQFFGFFVESFLLPAPNLPLGYMQIGSETDADFVFYSPGLYDPNVAAYDFAYRGTVTLGEAATAFVDGSEDATEYAGPLLVMTGLHDAAFCSLLTLDLLGIWGTATCGTSPGDLVPSVAKSYPMASSIQFYYPNAGHCWHLQNAAQDGFAEAHRWMAAQNF
jgi:pimeloyl-ACP methyl ester carboxylesterase